MRFPIWRAVLLAVSVLIWILPAGLSVGAQQKKRPITRAEIAALKVAILDEIYDYDYEGRYIDIAAMEARDYRLPIYIQPDVVDGWGDAIYKLPIGEVDRGFNFGIDGLVILDRNPRDKFPPTSATSLTLYMRDDDLCWDKAHWTRDVVWIDPNPSKTRIQEAIQRERKRKGFSQHDYVRESRKNR